MGAGGDRDCRGRVRTPRLRVRRAGEPTATATVPDRRERRGPPPARDRCCRAWAGRPDCACDAGGRTPPDRRRGADGGRDGAGPLEAECDGRLPTPGDCSDEATARLGWTPAAKASGRTSATATGMSGGRPAADLGHDYRGMDMGFSERRKKHRLCFCSF